MTQEEKAKEIGRKWYYDNAQPNDAAYRGAVQMAEWKDEQLDKAIDKALEHHLSKLKEGKITQYGMDNVFVFLQNIRTLLNS